MHNAWLYNFKFSRDSNGKKELDSIHRVKIHHAEGQPKYCVFDDDETHVHSQTHSVVISLEDDADLNLAIFAEELIALGRDGLA